LLPIAVKTLINAVIVGLCYIVASSFT